MEAKKRIENDPAIGEVLFHDDDCLIKVIHLNTNENVKMSMRYEYF